MTRSHDVEFRILGPLEVRVRDEPIPLGGAKQRAVLAVLLLRANEVVPVGRLIDEVWGDDPPPSAAHSLEAYVSRLRQLFNGHGPSLVRRGAGYSLELGGAVLDARVFVEMLDAASLAADEGDHGRASQLGAEALALWRGLALADISLASAGRAEADRLDELRLRTLELRFEAELARGRHEELVGEIRVLVGQNPYRESFVAQLMLALFRSGRQAEALDAYEQTRRRLDEDLGLQPSAELQQLSGQIVRQEVQLRLPAVVARATQLATIRPRARRLSWLVLSGAVVAAAMALTASGSAPQPASPTSTSTAALSTKRVALVLPEASRQPELIAWAPGAFRSAGEAWGFEMKVITGIGARTENRIEKGKFDLVLVFGRAPMRALAQIVRRMDETNFVFLDASLADLSLEGVPNVHTIRFAEEQTGQLAGYLSALVAVRRGMRNERVDGVSVVAGPDSAHVRRVVAGFEKGVEQARGRSVAVRVDYVDGSNLAACERVANDQIDAGSDVVFVDAGHCGLGALAVARTRGVWGIGGYDDGVNPGPHVLAITYKDYERAIRWTLDELGLDVFRSGEDRVLDLNDDYAVGIDDTSLNPVVSGSIWSKVVHRCSQIRQNAATDDA